MRSQLQPDVLAWHDNAQAQLDGHLSQVFAALANDDRLAILDVLRESRDTECSIERIADSIEMSRFATSRHLRILRQAGLVDGRRSGHKFLHRLAQSRFDDIDDWLLDYLIEAANGRILTGPPQGRDLVAPHGRADGEVVTADQVGQ
ncbi:MULTISPECIES: metalloregulator ArsR/SmtB family transcription factor [Microbacterium]|uniref:ArsR/SmtB family transcription factor n=1 Tax=Microbacterium TaxID=33882 RepID=UPI000D6507A6|nr:MULTISPECIES: metalloregulator ArsR/SmtB family transcription factor [Microbacterium]